ncbi:MAG TPA: DUF6134 family protein [Chryseolinea sp.]|nr:DUF6134 family protein [Chryseolinea sp.]
MATFLICSLTARAQKKDYEISVAGIEIGSLTITRELKGDLTHYDLKSKVKLWLFFRIEAEYNMTAVYRGDQLISSKSQTHTNKGDFKSSTEWDGHQYRVNIDAYEYKKDTLIAEPIHFNVGRMYFEKPVQGQKIYADNFGLLIPAVKNGDGIVVRILGNASTYHYKGNVMFDASMYHPLKNYRVKIVSGEQ